MTCEHIDGVPPTFITRNSKQLPLHSNKWPYSQWQDTSGWKKLKKSFIVLI